MHRLRAADFALEGGPPIWMVLDRIYQALSEAAAGSKRDAAFIRRAFGPFRFQVTRLPELIEESRRAFPGGEPEKVTSAADIEAVLQAIGRGVTAAGTASPVGVLAAGPVARGAIGAGHLAHDAWGALRQLRRGQVPEKAYRLVVRRVEELAGVFARCLRKVSERRPVLVMLDTCELIPGAHEFLRRVMRASGSRAAWVISMRFDPDHREHGQGETNAQQRNLLPLFKFLHEEHGHPHPYTSKLNRNTEVKGKPKRCPAT